MALVRSFTNLFKKLDRFGHKFEMHFEGRSQFQTLCGASVSLLVYVLILINALNIFSDFVNHENYKEINRRVDAKLDQIGPQSLVDNDFLLIYYPILDPRLGQLQFYQYTEKNQQNLVPITLGDCKAHKSIIESSFDADFLTKDGIDNISLMQCLNDSESKLENKQGAKNYKSIEAKFVPCHLLDADPNIECAPIETLSSQLSTSQLRLNFIQRSVDLGNYENPLQYISQEVAFEPNQNIIAQISTNSLLLEKDKLGFFTSSRSETTFLSLDTVKQKPLSAHCILSDNTYCTDSNDWAGDVVDNY